MTILTNKDTITYFISGHLDLTEEEFQAHYVPQLEAAIFGAEAVAVPVFVVGDAPGCDTMAMKWLDARGLGDFVIVYHMFEAPRNTIPKAFCCGGFTTDKARDEACTWASSRDIAWVRPGKPKKNGTAANLARRAGVEREKAWNERRKEIESWPLCHVASNSDFSGWHLVERPVSAMMGTACEVHMPAELVKRLRELTDELNELEGRFNALIREQGIEH